jgi:hypothetical protein
VKTNQKLINTYKTILNYDWIIEWKAQMPNR